jgi:hypothetical protein
MSWDGHFKLPEFGYEQFARQLYYKHLEELEAYGLDLVTFEQYNSANEDYIMEEWKVYERFLSES